MKVITVCLGNICRSPLAQGILEYLAKKNNLDLFVDSAGTASFHEGESPCAGSVQIANRHGIQIQHYTARQIEEKDLDEFDLVLAMDSSNYNDLMSMAKDQIRKDKIQLILNYSFPGENRSVPDSYYTGKDSEVFDLLYNACEEFIRQTREIKK